MSNTPDRLKGVSFDHYQTAAARTAKYPKRLEEGGIAYVGLGIGGEAGEVCDEIKKALRNEESPITGERRDNILIECGDLLWYIAGVCDELEASMAEVAYNNTVKLAERARKNEIKERA